MPSISGFLIDSVGNFLKLNTSLSSAERVMAKKIFRILVAMHGFWKLRGVPNESIEVSYAEGFDGLVEAMENLERPGDFQVSGKHETPMQLLSVEGVGQISFPVPPSQARDLITAAAERAPYGRGEQTLVDESVRRVWQIPPEKISFEGKGWASRFDDLVARVADRLGLPSKDVRAEFYNMLVYDEGGFFLPHRDTEKAGGMFGTLVVALPSAHEGGELLVRHSGREAVVDLRGTDPGEAGFAAFYADCEHEVRPVVSGYRVCLIFNLVFDTRRRDSDPQPPDERPCVEKAAKALQTWTSRPDSKPEKIARVLDHKYTASRLSLSGLKGHDAAVAKVLLEAAKISGCAFHLGIVHIEESGWAEYTGYCGGHRRWYSDDDEEEEDSEEYEVGEVCDSHAFIDQWCDSVDRPVKFGKIPLGENEVLPPEALEGEEPDEIHFSEATGNAGADFERCYLRAAIVLWPESAYDKICLSAGEEAGIARLGVLVHEGAKESVQRLSGLLINQWKKDHENLDRLLRVLNKHRDPTLLERAVSELLPTSYDGSQNETLVETTRILPSSTAYRFLAEHFKTTARSFPDAAMDLWNRLAAYDLEQLPEHLLGVLLDGFEKSRCETVPMALEPAEPHSKRIKAPTFSKFLAQLSEPRFTTQATRTGTLPEKNPQLLDVETTLLRALETCFAGPTRPPDRMVNPLWHHAAEFYLSRSEYPPPVPVDWAQQFSIGSQRITKLREFELFARDPVRRELRLRAKKEIRQTIHQTIERLSLDMTHVTERKGSPYTLVCTKTRASYERACKRHRNDLADMRRLLLLPPARHPEFSNKAARLWKPATKMLHKSDRDRFVLCLFSIVAKSERSNLATSHVGEL
jgi:hypothetical protein